MNINATSTCNTQPKKVPPLHAYMNKYCQTCSDKEYCNANQPRRLACVLCALVRNLEERIVPIDIKYDPKDFDKLFWERKQGTKGIYEQTSKKATNNSDLFQALQKILKEHGGFVQLGDYRFWFHQQDEDVVDRRKK